MPKTILVEKIATKTYIKYFWNWFLSNFILLVFVISTWLKFIYFNLKIGTFLFDMVQFPATFLTAAFIFSFGFFFKKGRNIFILITSIIISFIIIGDLVYVRYFSSLPSIQSLGLIGNTNEITDSITGLFQITDILLFVDIIAFIIILVFFKNFVQKKFEVPVKFRAILNTLVICLVYLGFFGLIGLASKFHIPFYVNNVLDNKMVTERYGVLGAHIIDIYKNVVIKKDKISDEDKAKAIDWLRESKTTKQKENEFTGIAKGKNVIFLQVEALQDFVIGRKAENQEITPNLNKLIAEGNYFSNNYFQYGLGGTADADFSANTSLYAMSDAAAFVRYGKDDFTGVAKALKNEGYSTIAYHAFNRGFWNRDVALNSLDYDKYYAKDNYVDGKHVGMGLNDEDFYSQTVEYMKDQKQPSFNYVISLSSHFPFALNDDFLKIKLTKEKYTSGIYNYYRSINYADYAIGKFVEKLKKENLYDNSIIVVYGDHTARVGDMTDNAMKTTLGIPEKIDQKIDMEFKQTPLIIRIPGQKEGKVYEKASSNIDIMPTVLNLLGIKTNYPMFGTDLFGKELPFFSATLSFYNGFILGENKAFVVGRADGLENGSCYETTAISWTKVDNTKCQSIFTRSKLEHRYSSILVKQNLFNEVIK